MPNGTGAVVAAGQLDRHGTAHDFLQPNFP